MKPVNKILDVAMWKIATNKLDRKCSETLRRRIDVIFNRAVKQLPTTQAVNLAICRIRLKEQIGRR